MSGGCLPETKQKIVLNVLPKNWLWLDKKFSGHLQESSWNSIRLRKKTVIYKVVTYGRWSLTRSGPSERIDCTDLNVQIMSAGWRVTWEVKELNFLTAGHLNNVRLTLFCTFF